MTKRRYKTDDWIALGLRELSAKGSEAIKLEAICEAAQLTRGSFYHHFEDHEAFLLGLAEHWLANQTTEVAEMIDPTASPVEQGGALNEAAMNIDYRLELGIRELARRNPAIDRIVKQADAQRLEVIRKLYQAQYGLDEETAEGLAFIEYAAFSGIILIDPDMPLERQRSLAKLHEDMMRRALQTEGVALSKRQEMAGDNRHEGNAT